MKNKSSILLLIFAISQLFLTTTAKVEVSSKLKYDFVATEGKKSQHPILDYVYYKNMYCFLGDLYNMSNSRKSWFRTKMDDMRWTWISISTKNISRI